VLTSPAGPSVLDRYWTADLSAEKYWVGPIQFLEDPAFSNYYANVSRRCIIVCTIIGDYLSRLFRCSTITSLYC